MAAEITALLSKGVIEPTADHPRLCLSPIFLVPKRSGNFRLILNHKRINRYIGSVHFRMETLASILPYLNPGDWTVSIDLLDAYHHVPIAAASRDLLGFTFNGSVYRFKALPFGLKPAPRLFTQLYVTFDPGVRDEDADAISRRLPASKQWMVLNFVKLNDDKTEYLVISSPHMQNKIASSWLCVCPSFRECS